MNSGLRDHVYTIVRQWLFLFLISYHFYHLRHLQQRQVGVTGSSWFACSSYIVVMRRAFKAIKKATLDKSIYADARGLVSFVDSACCNEWSLGLPGETSTLAIPSAALKTARVVEVV